MAGSNVYVAGLPMIIAFAQLLNDLIVDLPIIITDGRISQITAVLPWKDIWAANCSLEVEDLYLEIMPVREDPLHGRTETPSGQLKKIV